MKEATQDTNSKRLVKRLSHSKLISPGSGFHLVWMPSADTDGESFRLLEVRVVEATGGAGEIEYVLIGRDVVARWAHPMVCPPFVSISVNAKNVGEEESKYVIEIEGEVVSDREPAPLRDRSGRAQPLPPSTTGSES